MDTVKKIYLRSWRSVAFALSMALIAYLLYFHVLGSLLPGYSTQEQNAFAASKSWHILVKDPVSAPYTAVVWLLVGELHKGILATRIVSACFGLVLGLLFFFVARNWCSYRIAFFATIMFITSGAVLHAARLGTAYIVQMSILALISLALWYRRSKHRTALGYVIVLLGALLLYVPGMVWFELLAIISLRPTIEGIVRRTKTMHFAGMIAIVVACIAPLGYACMHTPKVLLQVTGLPGHMIQLSHVAHTLWITVVSITARSYGSPLFWVGHAPLLSAVEIVLGILGAYYIYQKTHRRLFMFGYLVIGLILSSLGGDVTIACLVPVIYLFIATGLDRFMSQWLAVFPRNPVARITGVTVVSIMLIFSILYQLRAYYVAWPHDTATRQIFSHIQS